MHEKCMAAFSLPFCREMDYNNKKACKNSGVKIPEGEVLCLTSMKSRAMRASYVEQRTWRNRMVTDITCEKKDMLLVNYEAPNGKKLHNRLWNGGNGKGTVKLYRDNKLIDEVICENVGCEFGEYDRED